MPSSRKGVCPRQAVGRCAAALFWALVSGCADETPTEPFVGPAEPTDVLIERADETEVVLTWVHEDAGVDGFAIRRRTGSGANETIATVPPETRRYTDDDPDPTLPIVYNVEALYPGLRVSAELPVTVDLDFLPPLFPFASFESGSALVSWLPPDFEMFDGFQITRIIERAGSNLVNEIVMFPYATSDAAHYLDLFLPAGRNGDRLRYQVASQRGTRLSAPVTTTRAQWSLPTRAELIGGVRDHFESWARHVPATDAGVIGYGFEDGSSRLVVLDPGIEEDVAQFLYDLEMPGGTLVGAVPQADRVVVAHRDGGTTTVTGVALVGGPPQELWTTTVDSPRAFVTEAHAAGQAMFIDGSDVVVADASDGSVVERVPLPDRPVAAVPLASGRMAVVETRTSRAGNEVRLVVRAYPSGTLVWLNPWLPGEVSSGSGALVISSSGALAALNLRDRETMRTTISATSDGAVSGSADGWTIAFTPDDTRAIIVDPDGRWPRALRVGDELEREDRFAAPDLTSGFVDAARERLWTFHSGGIVRVYPIRIEWGRAVETRSAEELDRGVPVLTFVGP